MSAVFADLSDGVLRAVARRMRSVALRARDTLRLSGEGGDGVVFLESGHVEVSIADTSGRVLMTRRPAPGDLVVLPAAREGTKYVAGIYGLTDASLLTLDRDGLLEGLGPNVEKVAMMLDRLWDQELTAAAATAAQTESRIGAPIVAFFSAKGGAGTSTLAVNTAAALARAFPRQVLLVDLAAPFGHAVLFADLIATGSIVSASRAAQADFQTAIRGNIVNHRAGMGVLPATLRPEEVDTLNGELTGRVLDTVIGWHKLVVVDLGTSLGEAALTVIERAECLVVVVPPEIAAMTDARRELAIFRDIMNVPDNKVELVLNQRSPHPPLDRAAVESILGRKMSVVVGFDDSRPEDSTLAGGLVTQHDPSSAVSRGSAEIAKVILSSLKLDGQQ
ncbi:MAG TPA: cyclic nucleotide-binding domain-containing protein [Candidatus Dormibacteraeota bacterium]|nr:cyclic nucleotide-binding domain-containing protein [Candidatus Dormibacteraeota bacterium]